MNKAIENNTPMTKFLNQVSSQIGPRGASDLVRDARFNAIEKLLISLGVDGKKVENSKNFELDEIARFLDRTIQPKTTEKIPVV